MVRRRIACRIGYAVFVAHVLAAAPVRAELIAVSATVESRTDHHIQGVINASETAFESFLETSDRLPIEAKTALTQTTDGRVIAQARGFAVFDEPRFDGPPIVPFGANPGEIGVSAAAFSEPLGQSYTVKCTLVETRLFSFTEDNTNRSAGEQLELHSALFPLGGLVIWGPTGARDLAGATVDATVTISRRGGLGADEETLELLTYHARLEGRADGRVVATLEATVNGDAVSVGPGVMAPDGVMTGSLGGQLVLPGVPIDYTYLATVDETGSHDEQFRLEALVDVVCNNGPRGGVGAAAVLGAPLFGGGGDVGVVVESDADGNVGIIDHVDPSELGRLITDVATGVAPSAPTVDTSATPRLGTLGSLCGTLGAEAGLMLLFMSVIAGARVPLARRSRGAP